MRTTRVSYRGSVEPEGVAVPLTRTEFFLDNGSDPVLSYPYPPQEYQLFIQDVYPRLYWTVPSTVAGYTYLGSAPAELAGPRHEDVVYWYNFESDAATATPVYVYGVDSPTGPYSAWIPKSRYIWASIPPSPGETGNFPINNDLMLDLGAAFVGRIQYHPEGGIPPFIATPWDTTEITGFSIYRKTTPFTTAPGTVEGDLVASAIAGQRQWDDTTPASPSLYYRMIGHTDDFDFLYNDVAKTNQIPGDALWAVNYGGVGGTGIDEGLAIAVDKSGGLGHGEIAICGFRSGAPFTARFSSAGILRWEKIFGFDQTGSGRTLSVAIDKDGNVIVTGKFAGTLNFGGSDLVSVGYNDCFLVKYSYSGTHLYSKSFGGASGDTYGNGVTTDTSGNIVLTGFFTSTVDFGGGTITSSGGQDVFLAKFNPDLTIFPDFTPKKFGTGGTSSGNAVAIGPNGNIAVTGYFHGPTDFGGGSRASSGAFDLFVAVFTSTGTWVWDRTFLNTGQEFGRSVAVDSSNDVIIAGSYLTLYQQTASFGGATFPTAIEYPDAIVAKYSGTDGEHLWSHAFGDWFEDIGWGVITDSANNVYLAGAFLGTVYPGAPDDTSKSITGLGSVDCFVAKYDQLGVLRWARS